MLRTTLTMEPEIMELAKSMAQERKISLSEAINYLIRKGLTAQNPVADRNGFAVFSVQPGAHAFGPDEVEKALLEG